jgi:DNA-directed RNA polymerase subunit E'/Rpb7
MFLIYSIEDKIFIKPDDLNLKSKDDKNLTYEEIVLAKCSEKYIGKILINHGLVISMKKLIINNNMIVEIEGVINVFYDADLIIFKPQIGDILFGKISQSNEDFITVDCEILKVKVPVAQIMQPNELEQPDNIWVWNYNDYKLYYDIGEDVRLKVIQVNFNSIKTSEFGLKPEVDPKEPNDEGNIMSLANKQLSIDSVMEILCTFNQEGLGPIKWWNN